MHWSWRLILSFVAIMAVILGLSTVVLTAMDRPSSCCLAYQVWDAFLYAVETITEVWGCFVIPVGGALLLIAVVRVARGKRPLPGHCGCGYDLTGNTSGVCPECGERI